MPAELCTRGSAGQARGEGKRCGPELQLQLPLGVGTVWNKTRWAFCDPLKTLSSGRAFVIVFLHPCAARGCCEVSVLFTRGTPLVLFSGHILMLAVID